MSTPKVIKCKAAIVPEFGEKMLVEEVEVAPPQKKEVRIKILATGICHSDVFFWKEKEAGLACPMILGHEAIGIVESVGPGVTSVKPGDTVIPGFHPQCRECSWCKDPRTNICEKFALISKGRMLDGTSRVTWKGQPVCVLSAYGSFSEYIVAPEISVAKVKPVPNPAEACLLGCAIPTGYGSAVRAAEVKKGSTVAIWGLGGVGLATVLGCRDRGAARIIGVDVNPAKFSLAKKLGCTDCIDSTALERSVPDTIMDITKGGLDYAFVSVGHPGAMTEAVNSTSPFWGVTIAIGLASPGAKMEVDLLPLVQGRTIRGLFMGGNSIKDDIPRYVEWYLEGKLPLKEFVSHTLPLADINEGIQLLKSGKAIRAVVVMDK